MSKLSENELDVIAVNNFREYLRIPSVHPDVNYDACVTFLENISNDLSLPVRVYHPSPNKPVVVITWIGQKPELPSIVLNSHMDVVPVYEKEWTHKPFGAEIDDDGNIYGRGAQDMKSVGIQYLEAIRRLKKQGTTLRRTIHVTFVPDEEIGGEKGMKAFSESNDFLDMNVGFALDEGAPNVDDAFIMFYGERTMWQMCIHCPGVPGHGSLLQKDTAGEKVEYILRKVYEFRLQELKKLKTDSMLEFGNVTTINLTQMKGGIQVNVIPPEFTLGFDSRFPATLAADEWEQTLNRWCKEAGEGVRIEFMIKEPQAPNTELDESNVFWIAFKNAVDKLNMKLEPIICPGATDSRFLRLQGIPAIGFSPINYTNFLLHRENEYLNVNTFLKGVDIYCKLITAVANV